MKASRFLTNVRGNVAPFLAIAIIPVLLAVGAAIDFAQMSRVNTILQAAAAL